MAIGSSISQPLIEHAGIQYRLGQCIGRGRYGVAFEADVVSQTRVVALKIKLKSLESQGDGEAWVHAEVHHPNIVDLYHAFSDPLYHYLVMEYCENGSLADLLQRRGSLTLFEIRAMFIQISGAAAYLHGKGIFHRDLTAENVLFDADGNVKIADFGLAEIIDPSRGSTHRRITLAYAAPEVIAKGGIGCHPSSDTWSIGVLLYFALTGELPFDTLDDIIYCRYGWRDYFTWNQSYKFAISLVSHVLTEDETTRWTPDMMVQHEFFSKGQYAAATDDLWSVHAPSAPNHGPAEDERLYHARCKEAGIGFNPEGGKWVCRGRDEPLHPILTDAWGWDVVDPVPWNLQPCVLVDV